MLYGIDKLKSAKQLIKRQPLIGPFAVKSWKMIKKLKNEKDYTAPPEDKEINGNGSAASPASLHCMQTSASDTNCPAANSEGIDCLLCGSHDYKEIYPQYGLVKCNECGLIFMSNMKSQEELKDWYSNVYLKYAVEGDYSNVGIPKSVIDALLKNNDRSFFEKVALENEGIFERLIFPYIDKATVAKNSEEFIEVGCAWGAVLMLAQKKGFRASGYEIARPNCEVGKMLGLDVHNTEFRAADIPDASISCVLFHHSLEHIPAPLEYLKKANKVLKEGGILAVSVPNFNSYWHLQTLGNWVWLDPVAHVVAYTGETLCAMLRKAGFEIIECFTESSSCNLKEHVKREMNAKGRPLTEPEIEEFIGKLDKVNLGECLNVIGRKV